LKRKLLAIALSSGLFGMLVPAPARANDEIANGHKIKHVLLLSVDGLHALDVANYVAAHPDSALAALASHGITFSNARTPANSERDEECDEGRTKIKITQPLQIGHLFLLFRMQAVWSRALRLVFHRPSF